MAIGVAIGYFTSTIIDDGDGDPVDCTFTGRLCVATVTQEKPMTDTVPWIGQKQNYFNISTNQVRAITEFYQMWESDPTIDLEGIRMSFYKEMTAGDVQYWNLIQYLNSDGEPGGSVPGSDKGYFQVISDEPWIIRCPPYCDWAPAPIEPTEPGTGSEILEGGTGG